MFLPHSNINNFFEETLSDIKCQKDTKAYIVSIFDKFKFANYDLSDKSITLLFAHARTKHDFLTYQNIGDWIFFCNTLYQEHLQNANKEYYDTVARLSYYSCYKLINRQWKLFEELADNYNSIEDQVKNKLETIKR